jgi:hypothetical protein
MTRVTAHSPMAYGCRAWGGCSPGNRCPWHSSDPQPIGALFAAVLHQIEHAASQHRRRQPIRGGNW